jgi:HTH-type transcriptional regulator/antitoxin HigA
VCDAITQLPISRLKWNQIRTPLNFEEKHYALRAASLIEVLMERRVASHLKHKDRVDMVRTPGIASEVAGGKRKRNADEIRRLSRRFKVSPEVFFECE